MSCKQIRRLLSYRREWTREEAARAEAHLAGCPACEAVARQYELMDRRFDRLPVPVSMAVTPPVVPSTAMPRTRVDARGDSVPAAPRPASRSVLVLVAVALIVVAAAVLSVSPPKLALHRERVATRPSDPVVVDDRGTGDGSEAVWMRVPAAPVAVNAVPAGSDGRITMLLLGIDRRGGQGWNYRTDAIVLASADPDAGTAAMLSIPRDLQVSIPGHGDDRINTANVYGGLSDYPGGGAALTRDTIEASFGIDIDAYVVVDFDGFVGIVDALGGIDVDVPHTLDDPFYPDPQPNDADAHRPVHFDAGMQHMDGERALVYARSRMTTSDADRAERQQRILLAMLEKVRSDAVFHRVPDLVFRLMESVQTDLTVAEILALATFAAQVDPAAVERRVLEAPLVTAHRRNDGAAVQLPNWELIEPVVGEMFAPADLVRAVQYPVAAGDNVWSIAQRFNLQPETIVWANPEIAPGPDLLVVGQELVIPPVDGVWHTVVEGDTLESLATEFETTVAKIVAFEENGLDRASELRPGQQIMLPGGRKEGVVAGRRYPTEMIEPITIDAPKGSGRFSWPATGVLSQGFWAGHSGIDIRDRMGTAVRAADAGYVRVAGHDTWGYGLQVLVDHGNGYSTVYAHLDSVVVRAGDPVTKGQQIGTMGATGRATGPHLHFEIWEDGVPQDPVGYLP